MPLSRNSRHEIFHAIYSEHEPKYGTEFIQYGENTKYLMTSMGQGDSSLMKC